ncbi:hypothetical protein BN1723_020219, partial [Verticillium longisporum]
PPSDRHRGALCRPRQQPLGRRRRCPRLGRAAAPAAQIRAAHGLYEHGKLHHWRRHHRSALRLQTGRPAGGRRAARRPDLCRRLDHLPHRHQQQAQWQRQLSGHGSALLWQAGPHRHL